jgi:hypothetical protein
MTAPTTTAATASIARVSRIRARGVSFVIEVSRGSPATGRKRIDRPDDRRDEEGVIRPSTEPGGSIARACDARSPGNARRLDDALHTYEGGLS